MNDAIFNKEEYLKRINFEGVIANNFETLKAIHHAQHGTIPFENFDICLGRKIELEPKALVHKLVKNKRGGYCFELNGLLLLALTSFGFEARALLGRVHKTGVPTGRSHQVTLVTIEDKQWMVDLGFGSESPSIPIPLVYNKPVSFKNQTFRLIESKLYGYMLQTKQDNDWKNLYSFDLNHVCKGDIEYGNHYTSTNQNSFFTSSRVAALPIENGTVTILNNKLKKTINGMEYTALLDENQSYLNILKQEFGIVIDANFEDLKPLQKES